MDVRIFIGDVDEFYCDAVEGNRRWAVWKSDREPLGPDDCRRSKGCTHRFVETMLGRFETEDEAVHFAQNYDVGPGKTKVII